MVFAAIFIMMSLWAIASPLMSVPDEQVHAIRAAAVVRGELEGVPSKSEPWRSAVTVPRYVANTQELRCFVGDVNQTPLCQTPAAGDQDDLVTGYTTATSNSPAFYAVAGIPSLMLSGNAALYAMRLTVALICSLLIASAFTALTQLARSRWVTVALGVAVTPMVLYLGGSLNPNGVEVAAMAALFATLLLTVTVPSPGKLLWERLAIVTLSAGLLANTRSIALLWVLLAALGAVLLADRMILAGLFRRPSAWIFLGLTSVGVGVAYLWFVTGHRVGTAPPFAGVGSHPVIAAQLMLDKTLEYGLGWIGYFGWLDRPAPDLAVVWWTVLIASILIVALVYGNRRQRISTGFWIAAIVIVPIVVQASVVTELGYIWQGRYTLALFVCVLLAAGYALDQVSFPTRGVHFNKLLATATWLTAIAHVATFVWVLRRYVVGSDRAWSEMLLHPLWQPPLGWIALTILFTAVACGCAIVVNRTITVRTQFAD